MEPLLFVQLCDRITLLRLYKVWSKPGDGFRLYGAAILRRLISLILMISSSVGRSS